jgi:hypothetical protein
MWRECEFIWRKWGKERKRKVEKWLWLEKIVFMLWVRK